MASIERTAYPRFKRFMSGRELHVFYTPQPDEVEIIASMPCYSPENVNAQRGEGVFDGSIKGLQLLNSLGYGIEPTLPLHLERLARSPSGPHAKARRRQDLKDVAAPFISPRLSVTKRVLTPAEANLCGGVGL